MGKKTFFHLCQQRPTDFVFSVFHLHFLMMMMRICELVAVTAVTAVCWDAAALPGKVSDNSCSFCRNSLEKRQPSYVGDLSLLRARRAGIICIDYLYCGPATWCSVYSSKGPSPPPPQWRLITGIRLKVSNSSHRPMNHLYTRLTPKKINPNNHLVLPAQYNFVRCASGSRCLMDGTAFDLSAEEKKHILQKLCVFIATLLEVSERYPNSDLYNRRLKYASGISST